MADRRPERGAAAVEMAFVAMFLILLVTGVADLGRAIFTYIGVQEAAEEGTMYASYHPDELDNVRQRAVESIDYPELDPADVAVSCSPDGKRVTVRVTHRVDLMTPVISQILGEQIELTRSFTGDVFGGTCSA